MKKLLVAILVIGAALYGFATLTSTGQNMLMGRVLSAQFGAEPPTFEGLNVVVCGSASPLGASMARAQACIAVVTPEHFFLFDVGARSPVRIGQARLPLNRLDGVFITHFHSDHIAALPDVNLQSWVQGRDGNLQVFGPTGVERVVSGMNEAYALDRLYRTAHHGEAMLPPENGEMAARPFERAGVIWEDDLAKVTAFPVEHNPIEPAVGYRVDYKGRSVVISGDSNSVDSLWQASSGADLVLHDALSRHMLDPMIAAAQDQNATRLNKIMNDVIDYHADSETLEGPAEAAGVKLLAYYHLVPAPPNSLTERIFRRGLSDNTLLVKDLHHFILPENSDEIEVIEP